MLFGFANALISFRYQWTYIFIIRWISYGSHNLTWYYYCYFFLKWHSYFLGFVFAFMESSSPHITTPMPLPKNLLEWQWSEHCIATPSLPLHYHSGVAMQCQFAYLRRTPTPLRWHTPLPLQRQSWSTLQCHAGVHTPLPPITTTPMPLSQNTPMPPRSVFGVLICIFATHSNTTP